MAQMKRNIKMPPFSFGSKPLSSWNMAAERKITSSGYNQRNVWFPAHTWFGTRSYRCFGFPTCPPRVANLPPLRAVLRPYRPCLMPWSPPGHYVLLLESQVPSAPLRATREKITSLQRTASLLGPTSALLLFVNAYKTSFLHQLKTRVKFTFEGVPHPCLSHSAYSYYSQMKRPRSPSSTLIHSCLPQWGSKHHCPFLVGKPLSSRCIFCTFCLCWWTEKLLRNKTLIFCYDAGEFLYSLNRSDPDCTVPKGPSVQ